MCFVLVVLKPSPVLPAAVAGNVQVYNKTIILSDCKSPPNSWKQQRRTIPPKVCPNKEPEPSLQARREEGTSLPWPSLESGSLRRLLEY